MKPRRDPALLFRRGCFRLVGSIIGVVLPLKDPWLRIEALPTCPAEPVRAADPLGSTLGGAIVLGYDESPARRPSSWTTVEDTDLASVLSSPGTVLIDSLGTWVAATIDELGAAAGLDLWALPVREWRADFDARLTAFLGAWREAPGLVIAVTNEVGWGLVAEHRSGRVFVDLLGWVNAEVAALSDEVVLVVSGRALHL